MEVSTRSETTAEATAETTKSWAPHTGENQSAPSPWPRWMLALTLLGVLGVWGRTLLVPAPVQRQALPGLAQAYRVEPEKLAAAGVAVALAESNTFSGNSQRFQRDEAIARSYAPPRFRRLVSDSALSGQEPFRGSYMLSRDRTHEHLTACLTPQGNSIGSYEDYLRHSHARRIEPLLLGRWLLGLGHVRDARCLWMTLSLPLSAGPPPEREARLAEAFLIVLRSHRSQMADAIDAAGTTEVPAAFPGDG